MTSRAASAAVAPQEAPGAGGPPCGCPEAPEATLDELLAEVRGLLPEVRRVVALGDQLAAFAEQLAPVVAQLGGGGITGMLGALLTRRPG